MARRYRVTRHFHVAFRNFLDPKFPQKLTGTRDRSLDGLLPLSYTIDFILLRIHKGCCLTSRHCPSLCRDFLGELAAAPTVTPAMFTNVQNQLKYVSGIELN
jgi:hypothetical protein